MIHAVAYSPNQSLLHRLFYSIHQKAYSTRALMILLSLASKGSLRILLADDDEDDRDIFINVLTEVSDSVHITVARNGQDALDTLSTTNELPDIIFLDLNMPVMGGADCLRMLKANPRLRIYLFLYTVPAATTSMWKKPLLAVQACIYLNLKAIPACETWLKQYWPLTYRTV